jgi:hypothetical protein
VALTTSRLRAATVIVREDCILLSLTKTCYQLVFEAQIRAHFQLHELMTQAFRCIDISEVPDYLAAQFKRISFKCNEFIWKEDDSVDCLLIIKEGSMTIS